MLIRQIARVRLVLVTMIIVLIVLAVGLISRYITDFPAGQATVVITLGKAQITHAAGGAQTIQPGDTKITLGMGDTVQADGWLTIHFASGTDAELFPGSKVRLDRFNSAGDNVQLAMTLLDGQLVRRVSGQTDRRASDVVVVKPGVTVTAHEGSYLALDGASDVSVGALAGSVTLTTTGGLYNISSGQGIVLNSAPNVPNAAAQGKVIDWANVRAPTYHADGSPAALPVALVASNGDRFEFLSDGVFAAPPGNYTLSVDLFAPYKVPSITLASTKLTEIPITLGEVQFNILDSAGKPLPSSALVVSGSGQNATVAAGGTLTVGPGTWAFNVARSDAPDQGQATGNFDVLPGQHLILPLHSDLFGGGGVQVSATGPDGSPQTGATVSVYADGADDSAPPLLRFKSDGTLQYLPCGKYVAVIGIARSVAGRFPFEVMPNQNTQLPAVLLGTLSFSSTDGGGRSIAQKGIYVASAKEMARLNLPLEKMKAPYGVVVYAGTVLAVPEGDYVFRVDDPRATSQTITISHGQNTPITVSALSPTPTSPPN